MATKVNSWKANDGSLHETECAATRRDLEVLISSSACAENTPYAKIMLEWMTNNATAIAGALTAYAAACPVPEPESDAVRREMSEITNAVIEELKALARGSDEDRTAAKNWMRHYGFENVTDFTLRACFDEIQALRRFISERQDDGC